MYQSISRILKSMTKDQSIHYDLFSPQATNGGYLKERRENRAASHDNNKSMSRIYVYIELLYKLYTNNGKRNEKGKTID